jgi:hypothetical protein
MKRIPIINEPACGGKLTGIVYLAEQKTDLWVAILHGIGEVGPADGSKLPLVERHGWPKHIANGLNLPVNIFAVQSPVQNYGAISKILIPHIEMFYGAGAIAMTGYSMGGIGTYNMLWLDQYKKLCCIVPVCGVPQIKDPAIGAVNYETARRIPILAVHGTLDTTVSFKQDQMAVEQLDRYNTDVEWIPLLGVKHDAWTYAYDVTGDVGKKVLDFTLHYLYATTTTYERGYADAKAKMSGFLVDL